MDSLLQDLRYALRTLGRMRGTAVVAILMLGVGIAATTTMASVVYAAMYRPLPFAQPDRLVVLNVVRQTRSAGSVRMRWPYPKIQALQQVARSFDGLAAYTSSATVSVAGSLGADQVSADIVSADYFRVLRTPVQAGRAFTDEEERPGHPVMLAGAGFWRRYFPAEPFVADRTLVVNGETLTIVGLLPEGFTGLGGHAEMWLPIGMAPALTYRDYLTTPQHFITLVGRLKPGVSLAQATAELAAVGPTLPVVVDPDDDPATWSASARPLGGARVDVNQARSAWLLLAAVGCVLLVTCINVATLLLIRARLRRREIAVRLAIGARRARIVRQLLTETAVLVIMGGTLGLLLTSWGIALVHWAWPDSVAATHTGYVQIGAFASPRFDGIAFLCVLLTTLVCTVATGLAPALQAARAGAAGALADTSRSTTPGHGRSLRVLAGVEIALAVLLLAGALLLIATYARLQRTDAGFNASQVLTFWIDPPASRYPPDTGPAILERVLERVQRVPGISTAALNRCTPFGSSCARTLLFQPEHPTAAANAPVVGRHYVSTAYFRTLGIPVVRGRVLDDGDRAGRLPVTVVNEAAARRFWPGEDPVGKHVWFGSATGFTDPAHPVEVVGVVADVKYWPLNEAPGPDFYTSYLQFAYPDSVFMVRASGDPLLLVAALRAAIAEVDPALAMWDVRLLDDAVSDALSRPRFTTTLTAGFALTAVILAGIGIFAVMASGIAARTRELAIRLALGSTPAGLRRLVFRQALGLATFGSVAGLVLAGLLLRLLRSVLYGVTPGNPVALAVAVVTMVAVALAAAVIPAARAAATEPGAVLRE